MNSEDSKEVSNSQVGFIKNKSHHTNQNSFYGEMTVFCYRNKQSVSCSLTQSMF